MKDITIHKGNFVRIKKRNCRPYHQPFFKVGSRWAVLDGGEDFIYVENKDFKSGRVKLTFKYYELDVISHKEMAKLAYDETVDSLNKEMQNTLNNDDHNIVTFYPLVSQLICLEWANKTRWSAIQHGLKMQKVSRIINWVKTEFDKTQRYDYKMYNEYDTTKDGILTWRRKHSWDDKKMYQQAFKAAKKAFPTAEHHDMIANALCAILSLEVYKWICKDAADRLRLKMPRLGAYQPLEMIHTTLARCMHEYLPKQQFKIDSIALKSEMDNLYNQIHEISFITYENYDSRTN